MSTIKCITLCIYLDTNYSEIYSRIEVIWIALLYNSYTDLKSTQEMCVDEDDRIPPTM
jgi:hypothetical protein